MPAIPTLLSGKCFEFFPIETTHAFNSIQDRFDSGVFGSRERWPYPPRTWTLIARVLSEADGHIIMGWLRDRKGGAEGFTITNRNFNLFNPYDAPTLGQVAGGALGGRTYYVKYTFSNGTLETQWSQQATLAVLANKFLTVTLPNDFPRYVTQGKIYISTVSGSEKYSGLITTDRGTWTEEDAATTVNGNSNSGQKVLLVAVTTDIQEDDTVKLNDGGSRAEVCVIDSIGAGPASLTMKDDLVYTHTAVQADAVETKVGIGDALPSSNNFVETVDVVLRNNPVLVRRAPGVWAVALRVTEAFP